MSNTLLPATFNKIEVKKNSLLAERLRELDLEDEVINDQNRRFKKILYEHDIRTGQETYYYNDGTDKGMRIITFEIALPDNFNHKSSITLTYY